MSLTHTSARLAAGDEPPAEEVARLVLRYLTAHPRASDTLDGIARWWVARQRRDDAREVVSAALHLLVTRGAVRERTLPSGVTIFRSTQGGERP